MEGDVSLGPGRKTCVWDMAAPTGSARCQAGARRKVDGHAAHLCLLLLAVGLLPHLPQLLRGPGELLLQQAPLRRFQRQGLAGPWGTGC